MLRHFQTHAEYCCRLQAWLNTLTNHERSLCHNKEYSEYQEMLLKLDLDPLIDILAPTFSSTGRPSTHVVELFRCCVLKEIYSNKHGATSIDKWREELSNHPFLRILCGYFDDENYVPPLGSFYDLMDRLWKKKRRKRKKKRRDRAHCEAAQDAFRRYCLDTYLAPSVNYIPKAMRDLKTGQKYREPNPGIVKKLKERIEKGLPVTPDDGGRYQDIFYRVGVLPSIRAGLIKATELYGLILSFDGTCVHTHANPHGTPECPECPVKKDCGMCWRHYSDPDAQIGFDSDLGVPFYGYMLYTACYHNADLCLDLPVYLRIASARRHDSVLLMMAIDEMRRHQPDIHPGTVCLDSAHDNYATYELLHEMNINALIDLNTHRGKSKVYDDGHKEQPDGTVICREGYCMIRYYDKCNHRWKNMCPCKHGGKITCPHPCSDSSYGRVIYTTGKDDIRFYPNIVRGSKTWKKLYNNRTSCERINDRILNDYHMADYHIHTTEHYGFLSMAIGIAIHVRARYDADHTEVIDQKLARKARRDAKKAALDKKRAEIKAAKEKRRAERAQRETQKGQELLKSFGDCGQNH